MRLLELHIETANVESSLEFYRKIIPHQKVVYFPDGDGAALVLADGSALGIWKTGRRGLYGSQAGKHVHFAFEIRPDEYEPLKDLLLSLGVEIIEHDWKDGHRSLYFFDPDHHQVEFMTKDWLDRSE